MGWEAAVLEAKAAPTGSGIPPPQPATPGHQSRSRHLRGGSAWHVLVPRSKMPKTYAMAWRVKVTTGGREPQRASLGPQPVWPFGHLTPPASNR
jgi:hypothetical protein